MEDKEKNTTRVQPSRDVKSGPAPGGQNGKTRKKAYLGAVNNRLPNSSGGFP